MNWLFVLIRAAIVVGFIMLLVSAAGAQEDKKDTRPGIAPDIREDESKLKVQRGNLVVVPIPFTNPTLNEGLIVGGAYFYPQSEEEKKLQPASLTAAGGLYSSNGSRAVVLAQQNYWSRGNWRFTGVIGGADLRLSLLAADDSTSGTSVDWRINGAFFFAKIARKIAGDWYGGVLTRVVDANQSIEIPTSDIEFETGTDLRSVGLGAYFEYDTRDNPFNSTSGRHFKIDALFNDEALGSFSTYQNYSSAYRSYHRLTESVVLAWEIQGCQRSGTTPLWDACTVKLRGFAVTDYLGQVSASGQAEARWQLSKRWGVVGFAGVGYVNKSFNEIREAEPIPSYGVGVRFSVLPAKRINMRVDFARSTHSDAIYLSVGEVF